MLIGNEVFCGNDSLEDMFQFIQGTDLLYREKLRNLLDSTPRAAAQSL
jgi:hypothetical protein